MLNLHGSPDFHHIFGAGCRAAGSVVAALALLRAERHVAEAFEKLSRCPWETEKAELFFITITTQLMTYSEL